ncbi:MAG TPA: glutamate--tRNA ligase, partial [Acidobacteriota bacterium]|nr:glutamate--tRNA ligase [Acidobacteriota bacterium]
MNPTEEKEAKEIIKKIVLLNALRYGGKASPKPVFGKLLGEHPQFRQKIKEISPIINEVVQEINAISIEEQKTIVEREWPEELVEEKTEETKQLPPLPNAKKYNKVVTRFS